MASIRLKVELFRVWKHISMKNAATFGKATAPVFGVSAA
jgi:hypothetical protein